MGFEVPRDKSAAVIVKESRCHGPQRNLGAGGDIQASRNVSRAASNDEIPSFRHGFGGEANLRSETFESLSFRNNSFMYRELCGRSRMLCRVCPELLQKIPYLRIELSQIGDSSSGVAYFSGAAICAAR
jgi:hypothetical protein